MCGSAHTTTLTFSPEIMLRLEQGPAVYVAAQTKPDLMLSLLDKLYSAALRPPLFDRLAAQPPCTIF